MRSPVRSSILAAALAVSALLVTPAAYSAVTTTFDPANAPSGTHVQTGSPGCTVSSALNVSCSSF